MLPEQHSQEHFPQFSSKPPQQTGQSATAFAVSHTP